MNVVINHLRLESGQPAKSIFSRAVAENDQMNVLLAKLEALFVIKQDAPPAEVPHGIGQQIGGLSARVLQLIPVLCPYGQPDVRVFKDLIDSIDLHEGSNWSAI